MAQENKTNTEEARRDFLKKCGKFAAVTPPAMAFLLTTAATSDAIAGSGGDYEKPKGPVGMIGNFW